jgi:DNA-binding NarL/FixJ family response regulator
MSRQPVRVLIADDHPIFREGLRFLLDSLGWAEVVGEAETGVQAVEQAAALRPDVVAMDLQLPELNGIEATRRILAANPEARVLVLTMFDDDDSVFAAMRAGALGYLVKGAKPAEVAGAIQAVADGEAIFGPAIARRVIDFFAAGSAPHPLPELTDREREVLALVARGHTNPAIARQLVLSPKTVKNHVSNIFAKLAVADRAEAIAKARRAGLGGTGPG